MSRSDSSYQQDAKTTPSLIVTALRRWWLLVIGGILGAILGYFGYTTQTPLYQSTSQVQVTKRDVLRSGSNREFSFYEDYLSGQIGLIESELILLPASKSSELKGASPAFLEQIQYGVEGPERDARAFQILKASLLVSKSKEAGTGATNNSTVNLAFKSTSPEDSRLVLLAVIDAYKKELTARSKSSISERKESLSQKKKSLDDSITRYLNEAQQKRNERFGITPETYELIANRWSKSRDEKWLLGQQILEVESSLETIRKASTNKGERKKLFNMLVGLRGGIVNDATSTTESQLMLLEQNKKTLSESLGPDHPQMKEITSKIDFVKNEQSRIGINGAEGDELAQQELFLNQKLLLYNRSLKLLDARIDDDGKLMKSIQPLTSEIQKYERDIANLNTVLADTTRELETAVQIEKSAGEVGGFDATVQNRPAVGTKVSPLLVTWLVPGLFLGSLLGLGAAVLLEMQDKSFRSPMEIRQRLGTTIMGHIPPIRTDLAIDAGVPAETDTTLVTITRAKSAEAEAYRGVRTLVMQATENKGHQLIQVTSPSPGDGKSTLAGNLAISLAQSGKRTVLIDCDFRKPRIHKLFSIEKPEIGLASVVSGDALLSEATRPSNVEFLDILPCGKRPGNPAELLSSQRYQDVLNELKQIYDYVIIDTPPLLAVSDPRVVAQRADGVILVFKITKSIRPLAERAMEYLNDIGANVLGVAVNANDASSDQYGYGYGYAYKYGYEYEYAETYEDDTSKF